MPRNSGAGAISGGFELQLSVLHAAVDAYYTGKIVQFGATPLGVDWTCRATQELRFTQLMKLCNLQEPFSINDLGCGYGALIIYLERYHSTVEIDYLGIDLSTAMIDHAQKKWRKRKSTRFVVGSGSPRIADYSVASGVYNVKLNQQVAQWEQYVGISLAKLHATSRRGFAVNFKAPLSRDVPSPAELYRTAPDRWLRFCKSELKASTELVADYGLREFTLLVRR